jgi:DNA-binding transcriptional regulator YhcF (GntR family)
VAKEVRDPERTRRRVLDSLRRALAENGHSPSMRELASLAEVSVSTVHRYLAQLERDGLLRRPQGLARCLVLLDRGEEEGEQRDDESSGDLAAFVDRGSSALATAARYVEQVAWRNEIEIPPMRSSPPLERLTRTAGMRGFAAGLRAAERLVATGRFSEEGL